MPTRGFRSLLSQILIVYPMKVALKTNMQKYLVYGFLSLIYFGDDSLIFGTSGGVEVLYFKTFLYVIAILMLIMHTRPVAISSMAGFSFKSTNFDGSMLYATESINNELIHHKINLQSIAFALLLLSILLTSLVNFDFSGGYIYSALVISLSYVLVRKVNLSYFIEAYQKGLLYLSLISLLMIFVPTQLIQFLPIHENINGVRYYNTYLGAIGLDSNLLRISSIFREPGVFALYLFIALLFEFFFVMKPRYAYIFVFSLSIYFTYSTAGIVASFLLIIAKVIDMKRISANLLIGSFFLISALIYVLFFTNFEFTVFSKFDADDVSYSSTLARLASVTVNYEIFLSDPFFGVGIGRYPGLFQNTSYDIYGIFLTSYGSSTNSFFSLLAIYGFVPFLIVLFGFLSLSRYFSGRLICQFLISLCFFFIFSSQDMRFSLLFYFLFFMSMKSGNQFYLYKRRR